VGDYLRIGVRDIVEDKLPGTYRIAAV